MRISGASAYDVQRATNDGIRSGTAPLIAAGFGLREVAVYQSRDRRIVVRAQTERDERQRIDLAGGFQGLLGLKLFEGVPGRRTPGARSLFKGQVALGHQRFLDLFVAIRRGGSLT